jgi:hypothetical protein
LFRNRVLLRRGGHPMGLGFPNYLDDLLIRKSNLFHPFSFGPESPDSS